MYVTTRPGPEARPRARFGGARPQVFGGAPYKYRGSRPKFPSQVPRLSSHVGGAPARQHRRGYCSLSLKTHARAHTHTHTHTHTRPRACTGGRRRRWPASAAGTGHRRPLRRARVALPAQGPPPHQRDSSLACAGRGPLGGGVVCARAGSRAPIGRLGLPQSGGGRGREGERVIGLPQMGGRRLGLSKGPGLAHRSAKQPRALCEGVSYLFQAPRSQHNSRPGLARRPAK